MSEMKSAQENSRTSLDCQALSIDANLPPDAEAFEAAQKLRNIQFPCVLQSCRYQGGDPMINGVINI